jgi:hypothetical protein
MSRLVYTSDSGQQNDQFELSTANSGSRMCALDVLNTDEIILAPSALVAPVGGTLTQGLNTLLLRRVNYLDALDGPVGLWNFNDTINAVVGPNFAVGTLGTVTQLGFTDMVPGFRCLQIQNAQVKAAVTPSLQIIGDKSIEIIVMFDSRPSGNILLSHGGTGGAATSNKLYELQFPSSSYPERWQYNWMNGVLAAQNFQTPAVALSPSSPFVHNMISIGLRLQSNVLTTWLCGRKFSVDSGVLAAPTGGSAGFLTLGGTALAANTGAFACASLAIYDYARTDDQWKASYNRSLGTFWGVIP